MKAASSSTPTWLRADDFAEQAVAEIEPTTRRRPAPSRRRLFYVRQKRQDR